MEVKNNSLNSYLKYSKPITVPIFKGINPVETIKHCNIGSMADGIIGKVKVLKKNGEEAFLNVIKNRSSSNSETYFLRDDLNRTIGEIDIKIKKAYDYDRYEFPEDPSHVFVDYLRNYSAPNTPYHNPVLDEYKEVGTRLLQIAQRRSDEACCMGNIKLVSKDESKGFYEKLGFRFEPQPTYLRFVGNQNQMYLPPESKEPLSKLNGGL